MAEQNESRWERILEYIGELINLFKSVSVLINLRILSSTVDNGTRVGDVCVHMKSSNASRLILLLLTTA